MDEAIARFGHIDVWINNVGQGITRSPSQLTDEDIDALVSPGVVRTDFGLNAMHGGPDSRQLPDSQSAEDVAVVIADVIETPRPDVYTRAGARERVVGYFSNVGADP